MSSRALIAVIGASVFAMTVSIGMLVMRGDSAVMPSISSDSLPVTEDTVPESTALSATSSTPLPATTGPAVIPAVIAGCGDVYEFNDRLPLRPCDEGYGVMLLQEGLVALGYLIDIDGYYGQDTTDAVQDYQIRNGLSPSGVVEAATWRGIVGERPGVDLNGDGVIGPNEVILD